MRTGCWRKWRENGENYVVRSFMICTVPIIYNIVRESESEMRLDGRDL